MCVPGPWRPKPSAPHGPPRRPMAPRGNPLAREPIGAGTKILQISQQTRFPHVYMTQLQWMNHVWFHGCFHPYVNIGERWFYKYYSPAEIISLWIPRLLEETSTSYLRILIIEYNSGKSSHSYILCVNMIQAESYTILCIFLLICNH